MEHGLALGEEELLRFWLLKRSGLLAREGCVASELEQKWRGA